MKQFHMLIPCTLFALCVGLILGVLSPTDTTAQSDLGTLAHIAGTYIITPEVSPGPQDIVTLFADGNASVIVAEEFGGGAGGLGFSNSQGAWQQVGERQIRLTVLNTTFNLADGSFAGLALVNYDLMFNETFQTFMGSFAGNIYAPGVNPLAPGDAEPTAAFEGIIEGQRVTVQLAP